DAMYAWTMSPDGTCIISSNDGQSLTIRDTQTMQERATLFGHFGELQGCKVSPDGTFIISVGRDRFTVWDVQTMQERFTADHHKITDFAISPDSSLIISCGREGPEWTDHHTFIVW